MNNLRNEGQPTLESAIYEPAGAILKWSALPDKYLQRTSRNRTPNRIYN